MAWSKRELLTQVVIPVLAILVAIGVYIWPQEVKKRKELRYEVIAVTPLGPTHASGFRDLKLLKDNTVIEAPFLATVRFVNSGDVAIDPQDFSSPIVVKAGRVGGALFEKFALGDKNSMKAAGTLPVFVDALTLPLFSASLGRVRHAACFS